MRFFIIVVMFLMSAGLASAGVLMEEWTEGTKRYCKYSDGNVIVVSSGSVCSSTN